MYVFGVPLYISGTDLVIQQQQPSTSMGSASEQNWNNKQNSGTAGGNIGNSVGASEPEQIKLGLYTGNFTRNEVQLSLTLVHYWANFVRTG